MDRPHPRSDEQLFVRREIRCMMDANGIEFMACQDKPDIIASYSEKHATIAKPDFAPAGNRLSTSRKWLCLMPEIGHLAE
jgi:hypothetical protein